MNPYRLALLLIALTAAFTAASCARQDLTASHQAVTPPADPPDPLATPDALAFTGDDDASTATAAAAVITALSASGADASQRAPLGPKVSEVTAAALGLTPQRAASGIDARLQNPLCVAPPRPPTQTELPVQLTPAFDHLRFVFPISMEQTPWDDTQWVLIEREGMAWLITGEDTPRPEEAASNLKTDGPAPKVFLDLTPVTFSRSGDAGLLGMAFHPKFSENRFVFFSYMKGSDTRGIDSVISRWRVNADGVVDPTSEEVILKARQPGREHNGGAIAFGLDGYLYIAFGDGRLGAGGGEPAQQRDSLMGKILRIDPDHPTESSPYSVPPDNPFLSDPTALPEIYALGLRNPWRFSFDREAGTLWLGDVGSEFLEEIDIIKAGGNYGWNPREGTRCNWRSRCEKPYFIDPVAEYTHEEGRAITGGFVYHGSAIPALRGRYVFSDFGAGTIWALQQDNDGVYHKQTLVDSRANPASFAQARSGELYLVHHASETGRIFRLDPVATDSVTAQAAPLPPLLSQTGCVLPDDPKQPSAAMIPYSINAPFWSDGAKKARWLALPDATTIQAMPDGRWDFPIGAVTMKSFWLDNRLIETRFMVRHADGDWGGYTYAWSDDQSDATLVEAATTRATDSQPWYYPSRPQCMMCHTQASGRVLGIEQAQMDRTSYYPSTGRYANQLDTLQHLGMLTPAPAPADPADPADPSSPAHSVARLPNPFDEGEPLEARARAYLHTNCAPCHRPDGADRARIDLRYSTDLPHTAACDIPPELDHLGLSDPRLIAHGDPDRSIIYRRASSRDAIGMPPIGSLQPDTRGAALLHAWISSLSSCPPPPAPSKRKRK